MFRDNDVCCLQIMQADGMDAEESAGEKEVFVLHAQGVEHLIHAHNNNYNNVCQEEEVNSKHHLF